MNAEQKKRAEELAQEYRKKLTDIGNSVVTKRDFLAGYEAGLNDPEALGDLEELAKDIIYEIDFLSREVCQYEYGVPSSDQERQKQIEAVVGKIQALKERGRV